MNHMWIPLLLLPAIILLVHGLAIFRARKKSLKTTWSALIFVLTVLAWSSFLFEILPDLSVATGLIVVLLVLGVNVLSSIMLLWKTKQN